MKWCDAFFVNQRLAITSEINEAGFWVDLSRNPKGNIYFGDGGTAASALAAGLRGGPPAKVALPESSRAVRELRPRGILRDPQGFGREATTTWIIREGDDKGALGCGFYEGHLSVKPYTVSMATTGGRFSPRSTG